MRMKLTLFFLWGAAPTTFLFWFFCGESAKKPKQKHFLGFATPNTPLGKAVNRLA
jgi:hypothetical protein